MATSVEDDVISAPLREDGGLQVPRCPRSDSESVPMVSGRSKFLGRTVQVS